MVVRLSGVFILGNRIRFAIQRERFSCLLIDPVLKPVPLVSAGQHAHRIRSLPFGVTQDRHGLISPAQPIQSQCQVDQSTTVQNRSIRTELLRNLMEVSPFESQRGSAPSPTRHILTLNEIDHKTQTGVAGKFWFDDLKMVARHNCTLIIGETVN